MRQFRFSLQAPQGWDATCRKSAAIFGTQSWQEMLESSFGCRSLYIWDDICSAVITLFKAGPFVVGYLGFPAGSFIGDAGRLKAMIAEIKAAKPVFGLACVHVPVSAFGAGPSLEQRCLANPETAISELQNWDLMAVSKNLRRDIRKAERSGLVVDRTVDTNLGPVLFGMYESTVKHRGGSLRYNSDYFTGLLELAGRNPAVQVYTARQESNIAGFAVIIHHGRTAFYLHGGSTIELRRLSPSDLLLAEAIGVAKSSDCEVFNFMASPINQSTLIRYKEKWGGETRQMQTCTASVSRVYPLFRMAETLYRLVN